MKFQDSKTIWREAALGEILPLKYGKARSPQYGYLRRGTKTFGSNGAFGEFDRALTEKPAIIVGRKGAAGAVHYSPEPCWPIDTAYYTEGTDETHLPFFRYLLESLSLGSLDRSTAIPSLSRDDYDARKIAFPPSKDEQRQIVAEIEKQFTRLDAGVAALRRVQANLKRYRAAVLKAACEDRLFATHSEPAPPLGEYGPTMRLPPGWRWATAKAACDRVVDCHNKTAPYTETGVPLVRTTNIRNRKIDLGETRFVDEPTYEFWSRRCKPEPGDVLFTREAPMGEAGIIPDGVRLCMGQRMMLLRASPELLNRYLLITLLTPGLSNYIHRTAVGSGVKHLRVRDVENLPIPLPPLADQKRIVAEVERRLSVIDELETAVTANLVRATRLRQSILKRAFSEAS